VLAAVLLASAMKLLNAPSTTTGLAAAVACVVLLALPAILRRLGFGAPKQTAQTGARETGPRAHLSEV
jgi:hypothetical protein